MVAIDLNGYRVAAILDLLNGAKYLYVREIIFPSTQAGWDIDYTLGGV